MTLIFDGNWVGLADVSDSSIQVWPDDDWRQTAGSSSADEAVASERGRHFAEGANRSRRKTAQVSDVDVTVGDVELSAQFEFEAAADDSVAVGFVLRTDGAWNTDSYGANEVLPLNGYVVRIYADGRMWLRSMVEGVSTTFINGVDQGVSVGPEVVTRLRFQAEGSTLRVKVWAPAAESEPASWQEETDSTYSTGNAGLAFATSTSNLGGVLYDYMTLTDLAAVAGTAHTRTIRSTTVGTLS